MNVIDRVDLRTAVRLDRRMADAEVRDNLQAHRVEIWSGGELAGFTAYEPMGGARAFVHTEIDDRFAGQGLGSVLVRAALEAMRDAGTAVLPYCQFVRSYLQRHDEFHDLVPDAQRLRFGLPPPAAG